MKLNRFHTKYSHLVLTFAFLFIASGSWAQFTGIGIETGPGARILFGNEALQQSQQMALGFSFGVQTEYRFSTRLSLRSGLYYELKGGQTPVYTFDPQGPNAIIARRGFYPPPQSGGLISFRNRDNFNFISLPLLFKVKLGKEKHWYLNAGASVGYLMGVRVVTRYKDGETYRNKPHNDLFSIEYSALLGIGYERAVNDKWKGHLEIRNHIGLNNLLDAQMTVGNGSLQTNSCYLLAGLTYRLLP